MEEEARTLLRAALGEDTVAGGNLADAIRARFRRLGGVELRLPAREPMREDRPGARPRHSSWDFLATDVDGTVPPDVCVPSGGRGSRTSVPP